MHLLASELLSVKMLSADDRTREPFRRQVTFRIGAEDAVLLEAAARAHGGIQAGIVAALRAYAAQRLQATAPSQAPAPPAASPDPPAPSPAPEAAAPDTPPPRTTTREPEAAAEPHARADLVDLNVGEAAPVVGLSPAALRARIKRGSHQGFVGSNGLYVARIPREALRARNPDLSPRGAAEVLGLRPSTIKSRCKDGRYPNARNDGRGWTIPASDLL